MPPPQSTACLRCRGLCWSKRDTWQAFHSEVLQENLWEKERPSKTRMILEKTMGEEVLVHYLAKYNWFNIYGSTPVFKTGNALKHSES